MKNQNQSKAHPLIVILQVAGGAYMRELKSRDTFGYKLKGELTHTAIAIGKGVQALRDHDPQADLRRARERAIAEEQLLSSGNSKI